MGVPYLKGGRTRTYFFVGSVNLFVRKVLSNRIVPKLRALVIVPTRDLAMQVFETFQAVCKGRGLKVSMIVYVDVPSVVMSHSVRLRWPLASIHSRANRRA